MASSLAVVVRGSSIRLNHRNTRSASSRARGTFHQEKVYLYSSSSNSRRRRSEFAVFASQEGGGEDLSGGLQSDKDLAAEEADRLRAAEKFMVIGTGEAECKSCGYTYLPANGDPEYPIAKGTKFNDLPDDWNCPVCGSEKNMFESKQKEIAGFAENQGYGLGTNSMTGEQKSLLIFGSLAAFFALFLLGYTMN
jgi:rubredoxin